jgi:uncharacterized membrane protein
LKSEKSNMIHIYLYTQKSLENTLTLKEEFAAFMDEFPHVLTVIDVDDEPYLREKYHDKLPFVDIGPFRLFAPIGKDEIRFAFQETQKKLKRAEEKKDTYFISRFTERPRISRSDKCSYWFSKNYMLVFNLIVLIYIGLPFLAPIFMKVGLPGLAKPIYRIYTPLCHQLAFRSWFLFGEQSFYPRELANIGGLKTYAEVSGHDEYDLSAAREFTGNEQLGYKVALCQRDVAIYGSILAFGIVFSLFKKRIKAIPWYLWIVFGLIPIGLDGFSQLLSQTGIAIFSWLPVRESTPFFRTLTGGMFGLFTAWYGYPYVRDSLMETRDQMETKFALIRAVEKVSQEGG